MVGLLIGDRGEARLSKSTRSSGVHGGRRTDRPSWLAALAIPLALFVSTLACSEVREEVQLCEPLEAVAPGEQGQVAVESIKVESTEGRIVHVPEQMGPMTRAATEVLIWVGHSRGDVGGFGFEVDKAGAVHTWGLEGAPAEIRLGKSELSDVTDFVNSRETTAALEVLSKLDHKLGRSDLPEVGIEVGKVVYGYPVCLRAVAPLEPKVKALVEWANRFGKKHFAASWVDDLPSSTCLPGEHF